MTCELGLEYRLSRKCRTQRQALEGQLSRLQGARWGSGSVIYGPGGMSIKCNTRPVERVYGLGFGGSVVCSDERGLKEHDITSTLAPFALMAYHGTGGKPATGGIRLLIKFPAHHGHYGK